MTTTSHMAERIFGHLEQILGVSSEVMEMICHRSTMGNYSRQIIIGFTTLKIIDLEPLYERYSTGDKLLTDKEMNRDIYLGGVTEGGLSFIMSPSEKTPDVEFET